MTNPFYLASSALNAFWLFPKIESTGKRDGMLTLRRDGEGARGTKHEPKA